MKVSRAALRVLRALNPAVCRRYIGERGSAASVAEECRIMKWLRGRVPGEPEHAVRAAVVLYLEGRVSC